MKWFSLAGIFSSIVEFVEPPTFNTTIRQGTDTAIDSDGPVSDVIELPEGMLVASIDGSFFVDPHECYDDTQSAISSFVYLATALWKQNYATQLRMTIEGLSDAYG